MVRRFVIFSLAAGAVLTAGLWVTSHFRIVLLSDQIGHTLATEWQVGMGIIRRWQEAALTSPPVATGYRAKGWAGVIYFESVTAYDPAWAYRRMHRITVYPEFGVRTTTLLIPCWMPFVLLAAYPCIALVAGIIRRRREKLRRQNEMRCLQCGYDLTGNVTGVCPECGSDATSQFARPRDGRTGSTLSASTGVESSSKAMSRETGYNEHPQDRAG